MDTVLNLWVESVARYNERRRQEARAAWYGWHLDQAERHRRALAELVDYHETAAEELCEEASRAGARAVDPRVTAACQYPDKSPTEGSPTRNTR